MREILYRAKCADDGKWVYGWYSKYAFTQWPLKDCIIPEDDAQEGYLHHEQVDPATVGQFTGLTDRNGVKIFEGDVLQTYNDTTFLVEWDDENGRFLGFIIERERRIIYIDREPKAHVIGNIHDTPELLEVRDEAD